MAVQRETDADEMERAIRQFHRSEIDAEARTLAGWQVIELRTALRQAADAMGTIKTKGLPYPHRRSIESARAAIACAMPLVAPAKRRVGDGHDDPQAEGAVR